MIEDFPILAVVVPLFAAFLMPIVGLLSKRYGFGRVCDWLAVGALAAALVLVASMAPAIWEGRILVYRLGGWPPPLGILLAVDGLNLLVALIVTSIALLVAVYSVVYTGRDTRRDLYYTLLMLATAGMLGITLTGDIFNLYVFFEIMCISSYALVSFRRGWDSIEASIKYLIISSLGTSFILLGVALLYGGIGTLTIAHLASRLPALRAANPLLVATALTLLISGFGIKIAMVPFHAWLPDAYQAAPTSISALLAGGTATVGVYALLRVTYAMFGALAISTMLAVFGIITMVAGGLMALVQRDLKRLLAYSGISQMGYILLGVGLGTALGVQGGLFHMLNNAVFKVLLFMCAGAIIYQVGTSNIDELGGLAKNMPVTAGLFTVGALSISGVPPFNGFASKWTIYMAGVEAGQWVFTAIAIIMSALTLAYLLRAINSIFLGQRPARLEGVREAPRLMLFPMFVLAVLCVVLGVFWDLGIGVVEPAQRALENVGAYTSGVLGG